MCLVMFDLNPVSFFRELISIGLSPNCTLVQNTGVASRKKTTTTVVTEPEIK